jgi:hypothetical protein
MTEPEIRFNQPLPRQNPGRIALLVGAFLALVVGAAVTMGASPSASPATPGASTQPQASGDPGTPDGGPWKGDGRGVFDGEGRFGGFGFGAITITSISGSNLSLETEDGWTRTIAVTPTTTITKDGQTIDAGALSVGDRIRFRQTQGSDGSFTITAIQVVQPKVAGTVTAVTGDGITVTTRDGSSRTITTTSSTTYRLGGAAASRSDVTIGSTILAAGTEGSGNAFTATSVTIKAPRVGGTVTAVSASTITVQRRDGTTQTIKVDADTTYRVAGVTDADLGDIAVGMRLVAVGRQNGDGSLDATAIGAGNGRFHGGQGSQDKPGQPAPSASPGS